MAAVACQQSNHTAEDRVMFEQCTLKGCRADECLTYQKRMGLQYTTEAENLGVPCERSGDAVSCPGTAAGTPSGGKLAPHLCVQSFSISSVLVMIVLIVQVAPATFRQDKG